MSRTSTWRKALPVPADGKGNLRVYAKHDVGGGMICEVVFDYRDLPSSVVVQVLKFIQQARARRPCGRCVEVMKRLTNERDIK